MGPFGTTDFGLKMSLSPIHDDARDAIGMAERCILISIIILSIITV